MGQEDEEAAELVATIRGEHVAMKTWYSGSSSTAEALRTKYGPYPSLWKEVLNWPGWKEARKAYLQFTQIGEGAAAAGGGGGTASSDASGGDAPRKRRSRWGTATDDNNNNNGEDGSQATGSNKRRSRWGKEEWEAPSGVPLPGMPAHQPQPPPFSSQPPHHQQHHHQQHHHQQQQQVLPGLVLPGMPSHLNPQQQAELQKLQGRLREINDKLSGLDMEAARVDSLPRGHRDRSPSPPPIYDADGKRKNTRAVRWRERYNEERQDILERLMSLNPATRQSSLFKRKRTKKIRIPIEEHPNYNFIGLIIGPRGKTQKELESKTGCKIAIRGKGSVKEGARGRRDGKIMEGDDEPLHVVITGDDQKSVDAAADMIEQMLVVIDDEKNVHKQQQLRELALLNGTLKEDEYCQICAEKGHRSFECPRRFAMSKQPTIAVKCAICGDTSHPTRDCTQKPTIDTKNQQEMDSDYMSFMAELDGKKSAATPSAPSSSGITIIKVAAPVSSSNSDAVPPTSATGITIIKPATRVTVSATGDASNLPPLSNDMALPPPSINPSSLPPLPPPTAGSMSHLPPPPVGLPPPPLPTANNIGGPPPPGMTSPYAPAASQPGNYYGNTGYGNYPPNNNNSQGYGRGPPQQQHHNQQQHYQSNQPYHYNAQFQQPQQQQQQQQGQQQQQSQQQQQQQQQPNQGGNEAGGWDYQAYYGYGGASGATGGGAGGFNWWEQ